MAPGAYRQPGAIPPEERHADGRVAADDAHTRSSRVALGLRLRFAVDPRRARLHAPADGRIACHLAHEFRSAVSRRGPGGWPDQLPTAPQRSARAAVTRRHAEVRACDAAAYARGLPRLGDAREQSAASRSQHLPDALLHAHADSNRRDDDHLAGRPQSAYRVAELRAWSAGRPGTRLAQQHFLGLPRAISDLALGYWKHDAHRARGTAERPHRAV